MIHLFSFKDKKIVLDVNSGAIHIVNDLAYDILSFFDNDLNDGEIPVFSKKAALKKMNPKKTCSRVACEKLSCEKHPVNNATGIANTSENNPIEKNLEYNYSDEEIIEAAAEIEELIENKMLFTEEFSESQINPEKRGAVIKAMCLHVAHDCNMRCSYCFADTGGFEGERSLLPLETGEAALDFLVKNSGKRKNLEVDFFGGEPLMNFDVVKKLVEYGRKLEKKNDKKFRFTITTNGLLLDESKIKYINENMDNVILSIDGRPEVNDHMRKTPNGSGTYELIIHKYKDFIKKRKGNYYVRGTFTANNMDFSNDVKHLVDLGFRNVSVEPVVTDNKHDFAITIEDLPNLIEEYDRLSDLYLNYYSTDKEFSFFHFNIDLNQGPCIYKRASGCGAGNEYVAVTPSGDLYPCHQFVGNKAFLMGNVNNKKIWNDEYTKIVDIFNRAHIYNKTDCRNCWAKFYCSGGCHANAYNENGNILIPYKLGCELEKKRIECAIGILATIQ